MTFALAPMSPLIRGLTAVAMLVPLGLLAAGLFVPDAAPLLLPVTAAVVAIYLGVWFGLRPSGFEASEAGLTVHFPWRRLEVPRSELGSARCISAAELRPLVGFALRVGAGGLFGGFGWLWSRKQGWIDLYVSRVDGFVWVERRAGPPLLLTPAQPEVFVDALRLDEAGGSLASRAPEMPS